MNNFKISVKDFSKLFWEKITNENILYGEKLNFFQEHFYSLEAHRENAEYNTGSIGLLSYLLMYHVAAFFKPTRVAEVGTFIGRSASAIAYGMGNLDNGIVYTCDSSNRIELKAINSVKFDLNPKTFSTELFSKISHPIDMFFIDGRLAPADIGQIIRLSNERTIIALDDFEGCEKGVVNQFLFRENTHFSDYFLVEPPRQDILSRQYRIEGPCCVALLIPVRSIQWVSQG